MDRTSKTLKSEIAAAKTTRKPWEYIGLSRAAWYRLMSAVRGTPSVAAA